MLVFIVQSNCSVVMSRIDLLACWRTALLTVGQVVDGNIGPFPGVGNGGGPSDARITPGNEGFASRQPARSFVGGFPVIGQRVRLAGKARPGLQLAFKGRFGVFGGRVYQCLCPQRARLPARSGKTGCNGY